MHLNSGGRRRHALLGRRRAHGPRALPLPLAVILLAGCAGPTPSATPPPSESPAATQSLAPSTVPPSPDASSTPVAAPTVQWEAAEVPPSGQVTATTIVAPGGDGLVAIGFDGKFGSTLWTSADGRSWRDVTPEGFASVGIASVIQHGDRLLGVGRGNTTDFDTELAAVYASDDGLTWRSVGEGPDMRGQMIDVVETDAGLFAVGGVPGADAAGVWHSTDGETWERVGGDLEHAFLWSIAEGGPGLVAVGWRRDPEPVASVWTSTDGNAWRLSPDPESHEAAEGIDVLEAEPETGAGSGAGGPGGRLVMVGGSLTGDEARIWVSDDGQDWSLAVVEGDAGLADASLRSGVAMDAGLVAVGYQGTDAAAWISTDAGLTWAPFGDPIPDAYFTGAFMTDAGLILTGATQTGTLETGIDARGAIWIGMFDAP